MSGGAGFAGAGAGISVREPELDLDAFEGPFDLLLALVLKEELELRDVDLAGIVTAFLERLAEREELDLEACGEFLVLIAALLELKARARITTSQAGARTPRSTSTGGASPRSGTAASASGERSRRGCWPAHGSCAAQATASG